MPTGPEKKLTPVRGSEILRPLFPQAISRARLLTYKGAPLMRTKLLFLVVALVSLAAIAVIGQKKSTSPADATPVQEGVMSDLQKQHSRLYSNYRGNGKLRDLIKRIPTV